MQFTLIGQETSRDMTDEQKQIFWNHFKVLDENAVKFEKPPANWKPKDVRDMDDEELQAYWGAFRQIMEKAAKQSNDQEPDECSKELSQTSQEGDDKTIVCFDHDQLDIAQQHDQHDARDSEPPSKRVCIRVRGKTSAAIVDERSAERIQKLLIPKKQKRQGKPNAVQKRHYKQTAKVSREGKRPCISIWSKVQLFKETRRLVYSYVYSMVFYSTML